MISWAYIFHAPESDPAKDRFVIERAGARATLVAVPNLPAAEKVAKELVASGVKSIELCGHFGVFGVGSIITAIEGKAAVGGVTFAAESVMKVVEAFMPSKA